MRSKKYLPPKKKRSKRLRGGSNNESANETGNEVSTLVTSKGKAKGMPKEEYSEESAENFVDSNHESEENSLSDNKPTPAPSERHNVMVTLHEETEQRYDYTSIAGRALQDKGFALWTIDGIPLNGSKLKDMWLSLDRFLSVGKDPLLPARFRQRNLPPDIIARFGRRLRNKWMSSSDNRDWIRTLIQIKTGSDGFLDDVYILGLNLTLEGIARNMDVRTHLKGFKLAPISEALPLKDALMDFDRRKKEEWKDLGTEWDDPEFRNMAQILELIPSENGQLFFNVPTDQSKPLYSHSVNKNGEYTQKQEYEKVPHITKDTLVVKVLILKEATDLEVTVAGVSHSAPAVLYKYGNTYNLSITSVLSINFLGTTFTLIIESLQKMGKNDEARRLSDKVHTTVFTVGDAIEFLDLCEIKAYRLKNSKGINKFILRVGKKTIVINGNISDEDLYIMSAMAAEKYIHKITSTSVRITTNKGTKCLTQFHVDQYPVYAATTFLMWRSLNPVDKRAETLLANIGHDMRASLEDKTKKLLSASSENYSVVTGNQGIKNALTSPDHFVLTKEGDYIGSFRTTQLFALSDKTVSLSDLCVEVVSSEVPESVRTFGKWGFYGEGLEGRYTHSTLGGLIFTGSIEFRSFGSTWKSYPKRAECTKKTYDARAKVKDILENLGISNLNHIKALKLFLSSKLAGKNKSYFERYPSIRTFNGILQNSSTMDDLIEKFTEEVGKGETFKTLYECAPLVSAILDLTKSISHKSLMGFIKTMVQSKEKNFNEAIKLAMAEQNEIELERAAWFIINGKKEEDVITIHYNGEDIDIDMASFRGPSNTYSDEHEIEDIEKIVSETLSKFDQDEYSPNMDPRDETLEDAPVDFTLFSDANPVEDIDSERVKELLYSFEEILKNGYEVIKAFDVISGLASQQVMKNDSVEDADSESNLEKKYNLELANAELKKAKELLDQSIAEAIDETPTKSDTEVLNTIKINKDKEELERSLRSLTLLIEGYRDQVDSLYKPVDPEVDPETNSAKKAQKEEAHRKVQEAFGISMTLEEFEELLERRSLVSAPKIKKNSMSSPVPPLKSIPTMPPLDTPGTAHRPLPTVNLSNDVLPNLFLPGDGLPNPVLPNPYIPSIHPEYGPSFHDEDGVYYMVGHRKTYFNPDGTINWNLTSSMDEVE